MAIQQGHIQLIQVCGCQRLFTRQQLYHKSLTKVRSQVIMCKYRIIISNLHNETIGWLYLIDLCNYMIA